MKLPDGRSIVGLTVVWKNLARAEQAFDSILACYPDLQIAAHVNEPEIYQPEQLAYSHAAVIKSPTNIGHGAALHAMLSHTTADIAFVFDPDITMVRPGLFETALEWMRGDPFYGLGHVHDFPLQNGDRISYLHPAAALICPGAYRRFLPFIDHGAPAIAAMYDIDRKNCADWLMGFHMDEYVRHDWRGSRDLTTAKHYSYGGQDKKRWLLPEVFLPAAEAVAARPHVLPK